MAITTDTYTQRGVSLAKGPALVIGAILEAAGLYFLYKQHTFLPFSNFPSGHVATPDKVFFGVFGANGWTGMFTAVCGGLLLFGAAQHYLAKAMSLIVGVALGAAFVISLIQGNVLGMAAANVWTKIGWAVCAAILLLNVLSPRRTRTRTVSPGPTTERTRVEPAAPGRAGEREPTAPDDREHAAH